MWIVRNRSSKSKRLIDWPQCCIRLPALHPPQGTICRHSEGVSSAMCSRGKGEASKRTISPRKAKSYQSSRCPHCSWMGELAFAYRVSRPAWVNTQLKTIWITIDSNNLATLMLAGETGGHDHPYAGLRGQARKSRNLARNTRRTGRWIRGMTAIRLPRGCWNAWCRAEMKPAWCVPSSARSRTRYRYTSKPGHSPADSLWLYPRTVPALRQTLLRVGFGRHRSRFGHFQMCKRRV